MELKVERAYINAFIIHKDVRIRSGCYIEVNFIIDLGFEPWTRHWPLLVGGLIQLGDQPNTRLHITESDTSDQAQEVKLLNI